MLLRAFASLCIEVEGCTRSAMFNAGAIFIYFKPAMCEKLQVQCVTQYDFRADNPQNLYTNVVKYKIVNAICRIGPLKQKHLFLSHSEQLKS
jgi:hypothetical protein